MSPQTNRCKTNRCKERLAAPVYHALAHWPKKRICPYKQHTMNTLANHPFVKMNGLGNEIVVVDLRAEAGAITAAEARAAAQPGGAPYDQLMALYAPRTPGTDGF